MGVDTKALLRGNIDTLQIARDLIELYGANRNEISVRFTFTDDYYQIIFYHRNMPNFGRDFDAARNWRGENARQMNVHYACKSDYEDVTTDDCTYLSLGCWGESVEIMETLLRKYGGWIMRNDSSDDWEAFSA